MTLRIIKATLRSTPAAVVLPVRIVILFSVGFFASGCTDGEAGGGQETSSGLAVLDSDVHDFGAQRQGTELAHTFSLINQGDAPVKIDGLTTSCHCVVAGNDELGPTTIAPGERLPLSKTRKQPLRNRFAFLKAH